MNQNHGKENRKQTKQQEREGGVGNMQAEKRAGRVIRSAAAILVILFAIAILFQGFRMRGKEALFRNVTVETENLPEEKQSGDGRAKIAREQGKEVTYQGEKYGYNEDLVSILFLGVDKEAFEKGGRVGDGKAGQADALFLLVLDTKTGKSRLIAISRDTMTDVNVYSDLGNFIGTEKMQLCLAYTYGDGKKKSCENTVRAVSRLFYGMPIAAYAALDLDAIEVLTDAVGGVEVKVTKDLTILDPSLKEGETKVLTGEQAQWYVRSRLVEEKEATADANSDRIERQKQYLAAFGGKAAEQFKKNPLFLLNLYQKIRDFSVTNLSASEVTYLGTLLFRGGFQDAGILSIKGEASMGETYAEFHVDEQAMYEMVLEVFYRKAGEDHET